jgi:mRNA-degrading endonuclease RelE of RelBE toxin-antitoxin system
MVKEITKTPNFLRQLKKFDKTFYNRIEKIIIKIIENPHIGKPMRYVRKGTRELYLRPFRLSYHYDIKANALTLLDIYHKDKQ